MKSAASAEIEAYGREGTLFWVSLSPWLGEWRGEKRRAGELSRGMNRPWVRRLELIEARDVWTRVLQAAIAAIWRQAAE